MSSRLKVAQVVCSDGFAGVERYVVNLSNGLAAAGCDVVVLGGDSRRMSGELSGLQREWLPAPTIRTALILLGRLTDVDIVHAHMTAAETAAVLARPVTKAPIVTTRHFAARRGAHLPGRLVAPAIRRLVSVQVAVSQYVASRIDGPSIVLNPGVPNDSSGQEHDRSPIVLVAQRLEKEKHTDLALHAWKRSGLGQLGWELHLLGGGSEETHLRDLAKQIAIDDSCRFLGPRDDLIEHYHRASLFLASRPDEALGLSVMEAMAAGLPVVAAAGGGHLETVGACPDAALFPPGDANAAGDLLGTLGADEGRRQKYGHQLQILQRSRFDASTQTQQMVGIYGDLVRRPTGN